MEKELICLFVASIFYWLLFFFIRMRIKLKGVSAKWSTIWQILIFGAVIMVAYIVIIIANITALKLMILSAIHFSIISILLSIGWFFVTITVAFSTLLWIAFIRS